MVWLGLFAAGVRLAEWLPAWVLYALARGVALALAALPSAGRARLGHNLSRASGEPEHSPRLRRLVRRAFTIQASNYVDLMRTRRITPAEIGQRYSPDGPGWDSLLGRVRSGRGCVLVTAHYGRIELLNQYLRSFDLPITLPVERLQPPQLYDLICALRAHHGVRLVPHDAALRPSLRALRRGEVVALFADWDPSGQGVPVRFFGAWARFPPGPAYIALRAGAPVYIGFELPGATRDTARTFIDAPLDLPRSGSTEVDVAQATQLIATQLERQIARDPSRWVMFHDVWLPNLRESAAARPLEAVSPSPQ
jgi:KDO2-lipid IV(A) lauroyltransferase